MQSAIRMQKTKGLVGEYKQELWVGPYSSLRSEPEAQREEGDHPSGRVEREGPLAFHSTQALNKVG